MAKVHKFVNYYQTAGGAGVIHWSYLPGQPVGTDVYYLNNWFVSILKGTTLPSTIPNTTQIDITTHPNHASRVVQRVYRRDVRYPNLYFGRNRGQDNNHLTLAWYIAPTAIRDLEPTYPSDMYNPPEDFRVDRPQ